MEPKREPIRKRTFFKNDIAQKIRIDDVRGMSSDEQWLKYKFGGPETLKKLGPYCKLKGPLSTC